MPGSLHNSLKKIEFPGVIEQVKRFAETTMGMSRLDQMTFISDADYLAFLQKAVQECARIAQENQLSLAGARDIKFLVEQAQKGATLAPSELVDVSRTIWVGKKMMEVTDCGSFPTLASTLQGTAIPEGLGSRIDGALTDEGDVKDEASEELYRIRRRMRQIEEEIDQVLERILHSSAWTPYIQEFVVTERFGRRVIPIRHEFRNSVPGIVHDQSGSGHTVFVEPMPVVERQNRLARIRADEREEIERILRVLSQNVGTEASSLDRLHEGITWLDTELAIARYGVNTRSVMPEIGGLDLDVREARHPLLKNPVPISVRLEDQSRILIISGPNTGGKTVALKTIGLIVAMALSGMMVPTEEGSRIPLFDMIWADIGDEQSLEQNLSTFSGHLSRLIPMMNEADEKSFCVIDEIGAGTDPDEGAALAQAMIHRLRKRGAYTMISTHYSRLKLLALRDEGIQNAQVEFNRETLSPTYHLVLGQPGSSHAFYIAERLGMDASIISEARSLMAPQELQLSDAIDEVNRIQTALRIEKDRVSSQKREIETLGRRLDEDRAKWELQRDRDREKARDQWRREMEALRDLVNEGLAEIRRKEGKERAQALEAFRAIYRDAQDMPASLRDSRPSLGEQPKMVGDHVKVAGFHEIGTITALSGQTATVEIGSLRIKLALADLLKVKDPGPKKRKEASPGSPVASRFRDKSAAMRMECDLRGLTALEAIEAMDKYLDDAVLANLPTVRIIHGKGTGQLRRAVAEALASDSRVMRYRLGDRGEGGDGVTVVVLDEAGS